MPTDDQLSLIIPLQAHFRCSTQFGLLTHWPSLDNRLTNYSTFHCVILIMF
ncbi:hypothetical protein HMPREF9103_02239 [Lentilactobacillus parafarraginis F0439]|uniref:Uncharacterized protein n=1 Tax=Lentilactobacillus parafarraginis F0439 TaxID=797515 RepID=G9ZR78_9LACO|nr:hypothetical protein HMPREF9103_02239 [Lentilactobacillus parafarraginis F0439]